jgi:hypothetical protein
MLISLSSEKADDRIEKISFVLPVLPGRRKLLQKLIKNNWFHIVAWMAIFMYYAVAPDLYVHFILKNGRPLSIDENIPTETDQIKLSVDDLQPIEYQGQDIYRLYGWAFSTMERNISPDMYKRTIVLISDTKSYFFPVQTIQRPGVQKFYKDLQMDLLNSGFSSLISADAIKPGEYRVGVIFKNPISGAEYYSDKPKVTILRTPNNFSINNK